MAQKSIIQKLIYFALLAFCFSPWSSPSSGLAAGLLVGVLSLNPFEEINNKVSGILLKTSVAGLGFGMNIHSALEAGQEGFFFTILSLSITLLIGYMISLWLKTEKTTSYLVSCGTAICGGSAIAAIAPVVNADRKQISIALSIIFILNAVALFIFPLLGHWLELTQQQFGLWVAIAIHDTSSVVGAASKFGNEALEIATTVKLMRALWIIPLVFISRWLFKNKAASLALPYFILFYVIAMLLNTYIPAISNISPYIVAAAKKGIVITLFLIGSGLSVEAFRSVGIKPFIQGILLWVIISVLSLGFIIYSS